MFWEWGGGEVGLNRERSVEGKSCSYGYIDRGRDGVWRELLKELVEVFMECIERIRRLYR